MVNIIYRKEHFDEFYYIVDVCDSLTFLSCEEELDFTSINSTSAWYEWLDESWLKPKFTYYFTSLPEINEHCYVNFNSLNQLQEAIEADTQNVIVDILIYLSYSKTKYGKPTAFNSIRKYTQQLFGALFYDDILKNIEHELHELEGKIRFNYDDDYRFFIQKLDDDESYSKQLKITAFHKLFFNEMFQSTIPLTNVFLHLDLKNEEFGKVVSRYLTCSEFDIPDSVKSKVVGFERQHKIDLVLDTNNLYKKDLSMDEIQEIKKNQKRNN